MKVVNWGLEPSSPRGSSDCSVILSYDRLSIVKSPLLIDSPYGLYPVIRKLIDYTSSLKSVLKLIVSLGLLFCWKT